MFPQLLVKENKINGTLLRRPKPSKLGVTHNSTAHFKDKAKGGLLQKYFSSNWANWPPEYFEKLVPSHFIQFGDFSLICYSYSHKHLTFSKVLICHETSEKSSCDKANASVSGKEVPSYVV